MWPLAKCISSTLVWTPSLQLGVLQLLRGSFQLTPILSSHLVGSYLWWNPERRYVSPSPSKAAQVRHKGVNPFTLMSNKVTVPAAIAAVQTFGVIDPSSGRKMDTDDTAIHWSAEPSTRKKTTRTPIFRKGISDWTIGGGEGFPGGEGLPRGGFPNAGPGGGGNAGWGSDKLAGNLPEVFMGIQAKAEHFLTQWKLYVSVNISNLTIANYYQRSMLFLTYIQGTRVSEWVSFMNKWLQRQVIHMGV